MPPPPMDNLPIVKHTPHHPPQPTQSLLPTAPAPSSSYPTPAPSTVQPQVLVLQLNTYVIIPDFPRFYTTPAESFQPAYYAFSDGSLVAPPLYDDLCATYLSLIIMASLFTVFARNVSLSAAFLWTAKVRKKSLLYTLFFTQLLGPPALLPLLIAQFHTAINCESVIRLAVACGGISLSLLITGILGVKAYRCLDSSRLVLVALVSLRTAALVILILDIVTLTGYRSLSGRCYRPPNGFSYAFIILLFVESLFVCLCFLYAVWKSHGSTAVRGRITVSLSLDDIVDPPPDTRKQSVDSHKTTHSLRGWWDYVSPVDHSTRPHRTESVPSILMSPRDCLSKFRLGERVRDAENVPSRPPIAPLPTEYPPRPSTVRMSTTIEPSRHDVLPISRRPSSPAISSLSRMSRFVPRVALFREVMRDELCYTTFITAFTVVSVVMTLLGVNSPGEVSHVAWMGFDWVLISCLVMHSFSRVIRRHENEAILQQPSAWHRNLRTDRTTAELLGEGRARTTKSPFGRSSQARTRRCPTLRRHETTEDPSTRHYFPATTSRSPKGADTCFISPVHCPMHRVETRPHTILPTHQPTPEIDPYPSDDSSSRRSDTKHTGEYLFGHRYDDSLPSLPSRPDQDDQHSLHSSIVT
ncbi:uncharacterized protein EDB91DRAFT_1342835 [Suillus paluster]|uniref:uncharacterized protein n=1 Tax=Suillus paluster TaxID=48578 RepID=UPI001B875459|nr:uncharacterized protein EDB91DRAFT_1342835 [Suillus paluster]KAG1755138.1 hypothetical protein EDB91DRAFT_1342835 [Suillus paluster]